MELKKHKPSLASQKSINHPKSNAGEFVLDGIRVSKIGKFHSSLDNALASAS